MHFSKIVGLLIPLVAAANASNEAPLAPCSPTTIYITLSTTISATATVTETVTAPAPTWWPTQSPFVASLSANCNAAPTQVTGTSTVYLTYTYAVTVTQPTTTIQTTTDQGPYYFSVVNGSTAWAGRKTPPATDSLVLETTVVLISPVLSTPIPSTLAMTSYSTVSYPNTWLSTWVARTWASTTTPVPSNTAVLSYGAVSTPSASPPAWNSVSTESVTWIATEPSTSSIAAFVSASATAFTGFGSLGWNSTSNANTEAITGLSANMLPSWSTYATGASSVTAAADPSASPKPELKVRHVNEIRQVGSEVTATIDGVVVSWINVWDGTTTITTIPPIPTFPSKTAVTRETPTPPLKSTQSLPTLSLPHSKTWTTMAVSPSTWGTPSWTPTTWTSQHLTPSTISWYSNTTATSPTASATPSCAYSALSPTDRFEINFDDLPTYSAPPNTTTYPPIFSPYHHMYWANGFSYVPPPEDPYPPVSPPQLAIFIVNSTANVHSVTSGNISADGEGNGEFGAGPSFRESAFWIDAYSMYIGCDNAGPAQCQITVNGYSYEPTFGNVVLTALQDFYQDPCPGLKNCTLKQIVLNEEFRNLTGLQVVTTVGTEPVTWYADNIYLGWSNNSCVAIEERQVIAPDRN